MDISLMAIPVVAFSIAIAFFFFFFLLCHAAAVFWLSPAGVRRRLLGNGFSGPTPSFPFGNLKEMGQRGGSQSDCSPGIITHDIHSTVFPYFARWREAYGKVFIYWLGTEPFLYIAEPEFLKRVTSGVLGKKWGKPNVFKIDRKPMFGNGLLMVEGEDWAHHRHIITPAFSVTNLNAMRCMMMESTTKMLDEWSTNLRIRGHQAEIDVERDITKNAAEIIARTSFGISKENGKKVFEKLQLMQSMLFMSNRMVGVPFSKLLYPKKSYQAWKLGKEIDQLLLSIINSRKEEEDELQHDDLLGLLLAGNQDSAAQLERKLTPRELVDECKTFFFGGHETTALALTWTLMLLALYPEWQEILREEIREVFGDGPLDPTKFKALIKMGWVLNEVLRLYSPAPNVQRQAREEIQVGDTVIPKGTNMWIDVVGMHHDSDLWGEDVSEFKPERFKMSLTGGCKHRMGFLPFGFGGRICVGRNLTAMEYNVVLSLILQRFSVSVSPAYIHSPKIMLTLRPSHGVPLILHPLQ